MRRLKHKFENLTKPIAFLLVCIFSLHALTVHGFVDSLVYCFEDNGDINIESTSDYALGFTKKSEVHSDANHSHGQDDVSIHASNESHKDIDIGVLCNEENIITRSDVKKDIGPLLIKTSNVDLQYPSFRADSRQSFLSNPFLLDNIFEPLSTIVLLI